MPAFVDLCQREYLVNVDRRLSTAFPTHRKTSDLEPSLREMICAPGAARELENGAFVGSLLAMKSEGSNAP